MKRIRYEELKNFGCFGIARLMVESDPSARIYQVDSTTDMPGEEPVAHAYVLLGDIVLNQDADKLTAYEVRSRGKDVTDTILKLPWSKL